LLFSALVPPLAFGGSDDHMLDVPSGSPWKLQEAPEAT